MSSEIEDIKKRLTKLEQQDLWLAKQLVGSIAPLELNIAARTMTGEEGKRFRELSKKKIKAIEEKIKEAETIESVFKLLFELDKEIGDYIRAAKVDTADKAMEIAHSFIKKYSPVALPLRAMRQDDVWLVDIDVGALAVKVAKVKVDARTGDILSYEIPEKK